MNRTFAITAIVASGALVAVTGMKVASRAENPNSKERTTAMQIQIQRVGSQASVKGPADWFTGTVRFDPLFDAKEPSRVDGLGVTFEPGARTAWHTHPLGQHLIITSGLGWVQQEGGEVQEVRPGDVVWFPPNVKHWHGATPTNAMSHIAIHETQAGRPFTWMEKVTDEQYRK